MKLLSRVVWAEGMYLAPQHFQAQNRYFEEAVHFATASLWRDAYGLAACQLDADALRNGTVSLLHARGMFQDGLPFDIPECDPRPDPRNIVEQFLPATDSLTVALAVPRWVQGQQNCDLDPIPPEMPATPARSKWCTTKTPGSTPSRCSWAARTSGWWCCQLKTRIC